MYSLPNHPPHTHAHSIASIIATLYMCNQCIQHWLHCIVARGSAALTVPARYACMNTKPHNGNEAPSGVEDMHLPTHSHTCDSTHMHPHK